MRSLRDHYLYCLHRLHRLHRLRLCLQLCCNLLVVCLLLNLPAQAQSATKSGKTPFDKKIDSAAKALHCPPPTEQTPVTMNAALVKDATSGDMAIIIRTLITPGWHLYAYVPSNMPYIATECLLDLPPGLTAADDWKKSPCSPSITDRGVLIWENEATFIRRLQPGKTDKGKLRAGLSYQTCNLQQCLPPAEKWFDLEF